MAVTDWIVKHFIANAENTDDPAVRLAYGKTAGIVGILCNLLLAAVKVIIGVITSSAAVISDAVNNLSDCISCVISMLGNKIAARPADAEHPFGHGRMEYISALVITAIIFAAAFELLKEGVSRIIHPLALRVSLPVLVILALTILVKFWMSRFNKTLGLKIHHSGLLATSRDSLNDMVATSATIVSLLVSKAMPSLPVDGVMTVLVSLYIFYSGYEMASDIVGKLIGDNENEDLQKKIEETLLQDPQIRGVHDLVIHDYGPGNRQGSGHCELDSSLSLKEAHTIIDRCEDEVLRRHGVAMCIHPDPVEENAAARVWKCEIEALLKSMHEGISIHDFHRLDPSGNTVQFDVRVPYDCLYSNKELSDAIHKYMESHHPDVKLQITFDRGHMSERYEA